MDYEQSILNELLSQEEMMLEEMRAEQERFNEWVLGEMEDWTWVNQRAWPMSNQATKLDASPVLKDLLPTEGSQTFSYTSLQEPDHQIRVVRLHPGVWPADKMIICDLETLDLRDGSLYEALSYEWGSPASARNHQYTIQMNGCCVSIRENLWWALYHLRQVEEPRTLWVDALCINQGDVPEKNKQVSRMGEIYSQAAKVIAWIGKEDEETNRAVAFLSELQTSTSIERYCPHGHTCLSENSHSYNWASLSKLCRRNHWSRLWIVQEVLLASDLHIQCGPLSFRWENVANVFH